MTLLNDQFALTPDPDRVLCTVDSMFVSLPTGQVAELNAGDLLNVKTGEVVRASKSFHQ